MNNESNLVVKYHNLDIRFLFTIILKIWFINPVVTWHKILNFVTFHRRTTKFTLPSSSRWAEIWNEKVLVCIGIIADFPWTKEHHFLLTGVSQPHFELTCIAGCWQGLSKYMYHIHIKAAARRANIQSLDTFTLWFFLPCSVNDWYTGCWWNSHHR